MGAIPLVVDPAFAIVTGSHLYKHLPYRLSPDIFQSCKILFLVHRIRWIDIAITLKIPDKDITITLKPATVWLSELVKSSFSPCINLLDSRFHQGDGLPGFFQSISIFCLRC